MPELIAYSASPSPSKSWIVAGRYHASPKPLVAGRVQGKDELGVALFPPDDPTEPVQRVLEALGRHAGTPTCNHRPEAL